MSVAFTFTQEQQTELVRRFESCEPIPSLMREFGCGRNRITKELKKLLGERYADVARRVSREACTKGLRRRKGKPGTRHTTEWKARIAASNKGKRLSDETRKKIGAASRRMHAEMSDERRSVVYERIIETKRANGTLEEHGEKHRRWMLEHAPMRGKKHTDEARAKMSEAKRAFFDGGGIPNRLGAVHRDDSKDLMREATSRMWVDGKFSYGDDSTMRSKLEKRVFDAIVKIWPDASHSFPLRGSGRVCVFDVYVPSLRLLIEVNGDYWHMNPVLYESTYRDTSRDVTAQELWDRDAEKRAIGESHGYSVITLWERDINSMSDEQILEALLGSNKVNHG